MGVFRSSLPCLAAMAALSALDGCEASLELLCYTDNLDCTGRIREKIAGAGAGCAKVPVPLGVPRQHMRAHPARGEAPTRRNSSDHRDPCSFLLLVGMEALTTLRSSGYSCDVSQKMGLPPGYTCGRSPDCAVARMAGGLWRGLETDFASPCVPIAGGCGSGLRQLSPLSLQQTRPRPALTGKVSFYHNSDTCSSNVSRPRPQHSPAPTEECEPSHFASCPLPAAHCP